MDINKLIPELAEWNYGKGIDVDHWISCVGDFEHAIGYSTLFWPKFLEYDDCIFRGEEVDKEIYQDWLEHTSGDKELVEKVMNHLHLDDLFFNKEPTDDQLIYLSDILKQIWECKLKCEFPNRMINVLTYDEDDLQITLFQRREK